MITCYSMLLAMGLSAVTTQPEALTPASEVVASASTSSGIQDLRVSVPGQGRAITYLLRRPAGYGFKDRPALLIVLHGTDDVAADAMTFWTQRRCDLPLMVVAPQAVDKGWRSDDVPALHAMLEDLRRRAPFDEHRILLAGFSAGGVMTMHMLYAEKWPLCAAAALANYVPPPLTADQIREQHEVPVFYAVGMTDINHEKMRVGLDLLRSAKANVDLYRPSIGHVLDPQVGQAAMDWLVLRARRAVTARIDAAKSRPTKETATDLEDIVSQARWHDPANADAAERALCKMEGAGRERVDQAKSAEREGRALDALNLLTTVEEGGISGRLTREVTELQNRLLSDAEVKQKWEGQRQKSYNEEALRLYRGAQKMVAASQYKEAFARCNQVQQDYPGTPAAQRAKYLVDLLAEHHLID